jgi:hypothetical protein
VFPRYPLSADSSENNSNNDYGGFMDYAADTWIDSQFALAQRFPRPVEAGRGDPASSEKDMSRAREARRGGRLTPAQPATPQHEAVA